MNDFTFDCKAKQGIVNLCICAWVLFPKFSYLETYTTSHIFNIFEMTLNKMRQKDTQGRYVLSLLMTIHIFLFIDIQKQSLKSVVSMEQTLFGF